MNENYTVDQSIYLPTRSTRKKIVVFSLLFCWSLIGFLAGWGDPSNTLHQSLTSWAFFSWLGIVAAYVGGASWENVQLMGLQQNLLKKN